MSEEKTCYKCKEVKTLDDFSIGSLGEVKNKCKKCTTLYGKEHYRKKRKEYLAKLESEKLNNKEELI